MPSFRRASRQAAHAIQQKLGIGHARHDHRRTPQVHSLGTARNYTQALTRLTQWLQEHRLGDLKHLAPKTALAYLAWRSEHIGQKLLDQERQAIQLHLGVKLPVIHSELSQALKSRAYTAAQVAAISQAQGAKHALATQIAYAAGLRAHELLTLQPVPTRAASQHRTWSAERFTGRQGERYTVIGKGGLVREVLLPTALAAQLEASRLCQPLAVTDRLIRYTQYYQLGGGKQWSDSFSAASKRLFTWSHGAHGLRHSYAQARMAELQQQGFRYEQALGIVSQELGHFRSDITEVYLR